MSSDKQRKNDAIPPNKRQYTVRIIEQDTLQEVRSFNITPQKFKLLGIVAGFFLIAATVCMIFFTPIKRWVPGYANVENNAVFLDLNDKIEDLETEVSEQSTYIEGLLNMISSPSAEEKLLKNGPSVGNISILDQLFFVPPVKGKVEHSFSQENAHLGTDIIAPKNTPVKSIMDGVVINSDWTLENGNTISIQHERNILSVYKHNSVLLKEEGSVVKAGEAIAIIGNSGENTSGPHLHFELWFEGKAVDPEEYVNF